MSSAIAIEPADVAFGETVRKPNVVDVGAWLNQAKALRASVTEYVPRHRAPGPAV
jgi:hypothetical protein